MEIISRVSAIARDSFEREEVGFYILWNTNWSDIIETGADIHCCELIFIVVN